MPAHRARQAHRREAAAAARRQRERGPAAMGICAAAARNRTLDRRARASSMGFHVGGEKAERARHHHRDRYVEIHARDGPPSEPPHACKARRRGFAEPARRRPRRAAGLRRIVVFAGASHFGFRGRARDAAGTRHRHHPARRDESFRRDQGGGRGVRQRRERAPRADHLFRRRGTGGGRRRVRPGEQGSLPYFHCRPGIVRWLAHPRADDRRRHGIPEGRSGPIREVEARRAAHARSCGSGRGILRSAPKRPGGDEANRQRRPRQNERTRNRRTIYQGARRALPVAARRCDGLHHHSAAAR